MLRFKKTKGFYSSRPSEWIIPCFADCFDRFIGRLAAVAFFTPWKVRVQPYGTNNELSEIHTRSACDRGPDLQPQFV